MLNLRCGKSGTAPDFPHLKLRTNPSYKELQLELVLAVLI